MEPLHFPMTLARRAAPALGGLALGFALLLAAGGAQAESLGKKFIQDKQTELTAALRQPKGDAGKKQLDALLDTILDYEALARGSLGDEANALSAEDRTAFGDILKQLVKRAYRRNLTKTLDYDVAVQDETPAEGGTLVPTSAKSRKNKREEAFDVDYLLRAEGASFRVIDIVTEGTSFVRNNRQQFRKIIKDKGFPELLRRMKKKLSEG